MPPSFLTFQRSFPLKQSSQSRTVQYPEFLLLDANVQKMAVLTEIQALAQLKKSDPGRSGMRKLFGLFAFIGVHLRTPALLGAR
jgi:hypothetical protein